MSLTSPQSKRRKLDCVEPRSDIGFTFIYKRLIKHKESLEYHHQRYENCWSDAKRMVQAEYKRRLKELEEFQTSSLQQLTNVKQKCDVQLQARTKQLQHDVELIQSLQKLKWKGGVCKVFDVLDPMEPVVKRALVSPALNILPNVDFKTGKLTCKLSLSEMYIGSLDDVFCEVPHRCFSTGVVGLIKSYLDISLNFEGKCCLEYEGRSICPDCVVGLSGGRVATGYHNGLVAVWDSKSGKHLLKFEGHSNYVSSLAAVGNNQLLSGSFDRTLRLWDLWTGRCVRVFRGHTGDIRSVCVFADSKGVVRAASGNEDSTIRLWDLETGECLRVLEGHTDYVRSVSATTDGSQRLVSGSDDNEVRVWDTESGKCLRVLKGHMGWVRSVLVLNDQKRVVSASDDKTLRIWDIGTGECLIVLRGYTNFIQSVSAFADGQHIISRSSETMCVWNVDTGECLKIVKIDSGVRHVCCLEDDRVVSIDTNNKVQIWK